MSLVIASTAIFTGDPARPWAEAVFIENNRIAELGSDREVLAAAPKSAPVLRLPGRLIAPGRLADLTVFDQDLFRLPPGQWRAARVEMTLVDGEIVYRK
jgi:hypothetical protein